MIMVLIYQYFKGSDLVQFSLSVHCSEINSSSSSLSSLPSSRARRPMAPLLPVLSFFLEFTVSLQGSNIIQSNSFCVGLPLPLFPSILPSIIALGKEYPLIRCPIQFHCLALIVDIRDLSS